MKPQQDINRYDSTIKVKIDIELLWYFYLVMNETRSIRENRAVFDNLKDSLQLINRA